MRPVLFLTAAAILIWAPPIEAQDFDFGGQIRPRFEWRDPSGNRAFTSMRTRFDLSVRIETDLAVFMQIQDVRRFGEERSPLGDFTADNLDLHQAYLDWGVEAEGRLRLRVGRQEIAWGGERLLGRVNWAQQGQSFDGARLTLFRGWGEVDLIGLQIAEASAPTQSQDSQLFGSQLSIRHPHGGSLEIHALHHRISGMATESDQTTVGGRFTGSESGLRFRGEYAFQFGTRDGSEVSAYMFGLRVGTRIFDDRLGLTIGYDHLSGDPDPDDDEIKVFDTLFATGHKFYGFADLFTDIPVHTAGRGLRDFALKADLPVHESVTLAGDLHAFYVANEGSFTTSHLGEEVDLTATYRHSPHLTLQGGYSHVFQDDLLSAIGRLDEDLNWFYLMVNVGF